MDRQNCLTTAKYQTGLVPTCPLPQLSAQGRDRAGYDHRRLCQNGMAPRAMRNPPTPYQTGMVPMCPLPLQSAQGLLASREEILRRPGTRGPQCSRIPLPMGRGTLCQTGMGPYQNGMVPRTIQPELASYQTGMVPSECQTRMAPVSQGSEERPPWRRLSLRDTAEKPWRRGAQVQNVRLITCGSGGNHPE